MPDQRETLVRKMIEEGTSDDDIRATLKAFDVSPLRKPVSAEDFMTPEQIQNRDMTAGDVVKGFGKRAASSLAGIGEMAAAAHIPGQAAHADLFNPVLRNPLFTRVEEATTPTNDAQRLGGRMELAAELAGPAISAVKAAPALGRAAVSAVKNSGGLGAAAFDAATHLVPGGGYLRGGRRLLAAALDTAPETVSAANKGGRLVKMPARGSFGDELASVLAEGAPEAPPVELPPPAVLPPGYTPRATVPPQGRPAPARPAAVTPAPAEAPPAPSLRDQLQASLSEPSRAPVKAARAPVAEAPPTTQPARRAYFLKSAEDIKAAKVRPTSPEPSGSLTVEDLPASWQSHTGQDLFPTTGVEAKAMTAALREEIQARGLTVGQAIAAVSKNKDIPTALRHQMVQALAGSGGR